MSDLKVHPATVVVQAFRPANRSEGRGDLKPALLDQAASSTRFQNRL